MMLASGVRVGGLPSAHRADARARVVGERGESGSTVCASAGRALARFQLHAFTPAFKPRLIPLRGFRVLEAHLVGLRECVDDQHQQLVQRTLGHVDQGPHQQRRHKGDGQQDSAQGLHGASGGRLLAKHTPLNVGPEFFAEDRAPPRTGFALYGWAPFGGHLPFAAKPLTDGGLPHTESRGHGRLAAEALDGALDCIHAPQYRHCRCARQAHCLLQATPVGIREMYTGTELGRALKAAMEAKGVNQQAVAQAFGISQPSVSEWIKFGRIAKRHIPRLVAFFADVVGPEHWGLPHTWQDEGDLDAESLDIARRFSRLNPEDRQRFRALLETPSEGAAPSVDLAARMARLLTIISTTPADKQLQAWISAEVAVLHVRSGVADAANSNEPDKTLPREGHRPGEGTQPT